MSESVAVSSVTPKETPKDGIDLAPGQNPETGLIEKTGDDQFVMPDKFQGKSAEEIARAYAELEKKLGAGKEETPAASEDQEQPEGDDKDGTDSAEEMQEAATEAIKVAGLEMADFTKEFEESGQLSEDSYKRLEEAGFPKAVVDTYLRGIQNAVSEAQALSENQVLTLQNEVGGPQAYQVMAQWAVSNLTEAERADFDTAVGSGDVAKARSAILNLHGRYVASMGQPPRTSVRGKTSTPTVQPFASYAQVKEAMSDPRYANDPAFRAEVVKRIAASPNL
ncbi:MAG: hypothetical protein KKE29_19975 [Proteobacteria bacterium]|nr:hypothetical protein [Pseudomonadota bacterium]MBV1715968.1 hypothetical protein [Desulfarculus sp.]